jgi:Uma2 family endonuclease
MSAMPKSNRDLTPSEPMPLRWTKQEYMACAQQGGFEGLKVYLFRGDLLKMAPIGPEQSGSTGENNSLFVKIFEPKGFVVRVQCPIDVPGQSMPEPDFAIVTRDQNRRRPAPNHAVLIVEMSFSTQKHDREKAQEYAGTGVADYWIVDLENRRMEVYRGIIDDPTALHGKRYADIKVFADTDSIAPLAAPEAMVRVGDMIITPLP